VIKRRSTRKKHRVVDRHKVEELDLFAENTSGLYNQKKSILANILRRRKSGTYDPKKAPKLWMYWVDAASKQYRKEFPHSGIGGRGQVFDKPTREALAKELAKRYAKGVE
jgi:hypothetical protein